MVARLKLKEIDGRAPPGVKYAAATLPQKVALRKVGGVPWPSLKSCGPKLNAIHLAR